VAALGFVMSLRASLESEADVTDLRKLRRNQARCVCGVIKRWNMRSICLAVILTVSAFSVAQAAEIRILNTGIVNPPGMRGITDAFTKSTGIKVTVVNEPVAKVLSDLQTGTPPADIVILPIQQMGDLAFAGGIKPGSLSPLGRVELGLWAKAGAPHPDISTVAKFVDVLKAAPVVMYNDPASDSIADQFFDNMLRRPEFAGVHGMKSTGDAVAGLIRSKTADTTTLALGLLHAVHPSDGEGPKDAPELIGALPMELRPYVDMTVAISPRTTDEKDADAFITFMRQPDMAPLWKIRGLYLYNVPAK
jgi:molybdate transport system substrate-binding protein